VYNKERKQIEEEKNLDIKEQKRSLFKKRGSKIKNRRRRNRGDMLMCFEVLKKSRRGSDLIGERRAALL